MICFASFCSKLRAHTINEGSLKFFARFPLSMSMVYYTGKVKTARNVYKHRPTNRMTINKKVIVYCEMDAEHERNRSYVIARLHKSSISNTNNEKVIWLECPMLRIYIHRTWELTTGSTGEKRNVLHLYDLNTDTHTRSHGHIEQVKSVVSTHDYIDFIAFFLGFPSETSFRIFSVPPFGPCRRQSVILLH